MPRLLLALVSCLVVLGGGVAIGAPTATVLKISADPGGGLRYDRSTLRAKPGRVTITMRNPSALPHNVAIRGKGVKNVGKVVLKGGVSTATATVKVGRYVFYCSVAGHEQGGMKGVLTVR